MEKRLRELLSGGGGNYILPFFWQHGESEELLREGMARIQESGIGAVCVESRPHPDFAGPGWWRDMDVIMDEAGKRGMRVWVLDDAHFPTGYVNGKIGEDSPYGKVFLDYYHIDVLGPAPRRSFLVALEKGEKLEAVTAGRRAGEETEAVIAGRRAGEKPEAVTAGRRAEGDPERLRDVVDLTEKVRDGILYWDVPEGDWVLTVLKTTRKGRVRPGYLNVIDRDAVRFFLETVYEPHYAHYGEAFGETFAGFFSDEPELGNVISHHRIGHSDAPLPWCGELEERLRSRWGAEYGSMLTALFSDMESVSPRARVAFMDGVTGLYDANFCSQIGQWCRDRGVEYIGHVIEDNGCHAMMGLGTGHFFRALRGQDMSGIDVVLQQIRPGFENRKFHHIGGKGLYDGRFFQFGLAKMGASLGHFDPKKKGRTMCEMYGAYGWTEGLKLMKWLTDHMLVRGVNYFVPHAFTMKDFPDPDCPPHFYARGNNPQYPYFKYLMQYMNRVSHLLNGGVHVPCAALFYNACAEWAGDYVPFEKAGMDLARAQIDYEVLSEDMLLGCRCEEGCLIAGEESCGALVLPYCEYLPGKLLDWCADAAGRGLKIFFLESPPKVLETGEVFRCPDTEVIAGERLAECLREIGVGEIRCEPEAPELRYYHYRQKDGEYYLFFNEAANRTVETEVSLPLDEGERVLRYDAFDNRLERASWEYGRLRLRLEPYESYLLYVGEAEEVLCALAGAEECASIDVETSWQVRLTRFDSALAGGKSRTAGRGNTASGEQEDAEKAEKLQLAELGDMTAPDFWPDFSGVMEYETHFDLPGSWNQGEKCCERRVEIDLGEVYETAEVWLNDRNLGVRIAPPYRVGGKAVLRAKDNVLRVRAVNTLVHAQRDFLSATMPVEPSGLLGPVRVKVFSQ